MKKLILTGALRYNDNGELFLGVNNGGTPEVYALDDARANRLLKTFHPSTGFNFFEEYAGTEAGVTPTKVKDDDRPAQRALGPKPKSNNERRPRNERPGRAPLQAKTDGIEDADAVTV